MAPVTGGEKTCQGRDKLWCEVTGFSVKSHTNWVFGQRKTRVSVTGKLGFRSEANWGFGQRKTRVSVREKLGFRSEKN